MYAPQEAALLLKPICSIPLLVLMPVRQLSAVDALYPGLRSGQVHLVVHDEQHLDELSGLAVELDELLLEEVGCRDAGASQSICSAVQVSIRAGGIAVDVLQLTSSASTDDARVARRCAMPFQGMITAKQAHKDDIKGIYYESF